MLLLVLLAVLSHAAAAGFIAQHDPTKACPPPAPAWVAVGLRNIERLQSAPSDVWPHHRRHDDRPDWRDGPAAAAARLRRFYAGNISCSGDVGDRQLDIGGGFDLPSAAPAECLDRDRRMVGATANRRETVAVEPASGGAVLVVVATFDAAPPAGAPPVARGLTNVYRYTYDGRGLCTKWEAHYDPVLITAALRAHSPKCEGASWLWRLGVPAAAGLLAIFVVLLVS